MKYPLFLVATFSLTMGQAQENQTNEPSKKDPFQKSGPEEVEAYDRLPKNISIHFETFSMPLQQAAQFQRENLADEAFYQRILDELSNDSVKQESLNIIRARSGETATAESIREYIYPTEYQPGEIPDTVGIAIADPVEKDKTAKIDQEALKTLANSQPISEIKGLATPVTPVSFESRSLGDLLEIQPTIGASNDVIDLRINPNSTFLAELKDWGSEDTKAEMPIIESQRVNTGATIIPDRPYLLSTYNRPPNSTIAPDSADRVWFAFVTARIIVMNP